MMPAAWKWLLAILIAALPIGVWWMAATPDAPNLPPGFNPSAAHYPEAMERLESASQTLVTISLATLGGAGFLLIRGRSLLVGAGAFAVFGCSVISLYYATELGRGAALTLAADAGDITHLTPLLDVQAIAALAAGAALALMACLTAYFGQGDDKP